MEWVPIESVYSDEEMERLRKICAGMTPSVRPASDEPFSWDGLEDEMRREFQKAKDDLMALASER